MCEKIKIADDAIVVGEENSAEIECGNTPAELWYKKMVMGERGYYITSEGEAIPEETAEEMDWETADMDAE